MKTNTKTTLTAIALGVTLLQGCAGVTTQLVAQTIAIDMVANEIRTNFSAKDFGPIDNSLNAKKSIYVSAEFHHDKRRIANAMGELQAARICKTFTENTHALKTQYKCYIVANSDSEKRIKTMAYGTPKSDGVYLHLGSKEYQGVFTGSTYSLTYKDMSNNKVHQFTSVNLFKRDQSIEYAAEYLARLAQKANEKVK